ncbi:hypothetical protein GWK26_09860 [haloarchaeon 3A1-DGR]|nr:hypothetical protein GWK26_09860 [haloarchaeon 3A1-DGR]
MDGDRTDVVTEWEAETVSDGIAGLSRLADRDFSGVVTDGAVRAYLSNGRVVGVTGGSLSAFEDASGTAYRAPDESLPLLFAMQTRGGEQKAQYYTNETPISEADRTLSQSSFTGYIELSENVLSGDYYVVYYGGESFPVAFIGNAEQLKTGAEAFELADDEVGIYTVYEVDLEVQDVPEPAAAAGSTVGGRGSFADDPGSSTDDEEPTEPSDAADADAAGNADGGSDAGDADAARNDDDDVAVATGTDPAASPDDESATADAAEPDRAASPDAATDDATTADRATDAETEGAAADAGNADAGTTVDDAEGGAGTEPAGSGPDDAERGGGSERDEAETRPESAGSRADDATTRPDDTEAKIDDATTRRSDAAATTDAGTASERTGDREPRRDTTTTDAATGPRPSRHREAERRREAAPSGGDQKSAGEPDASDSDSVFSQEAEWRETKSIPSIDPSETRADRRSAAGDDGNPGASAETGGSRSGASERSPRPTDRSPESRQSATTRRSGSAAESGSQSAPNRQGSTTDANAGTARSGSERPDLREELDRLEGALAETTEERDRLEEERDRLEEERDRLQAERDDLVAERDELSAEADRLEERVGELESELDRVRGDLEEARSQLPEGDRVLSPADALAGTNLFVRYGSKGGATLEKAHDGSIGHDELVNNLRIEHHTSFEDERAVVEGRPYREFLVETMEFGFTKWVVTELLFEIRETGNVSGLQDLYDAIPRIDRAEIGGSVSLVYESEGEEHREQQAFDLVLRDRMGNPLVVADLNDGRDPTPEGTLEGLVETGSRLAEGNDAFTAGFAVTSSFFEPGALEEAADATGGGLLNRSKKRSFVKISRKQGFHLCLAEARDRGFHLTVPEL